jgi:Flp pilus assembly CpaF family ATPase
MSSLDRILPFLTPIEDLLVDPAITEVMVNDGGRQVFVERRGCIEYVPDRTWEVRNLTVAIKNIARACGDEISERQPMLDARLEDGSRRCDDRRAPKTDPLTSGCSRTDLGWTI